MEHQDSCCSQYFLDTLSPTQPSDASNFGGQVQSFPTTGPFRNTSFIRKQRGSLLDCFKELSVYFIFTLSVFNCGLHHLLSRLLKLSPKLFPFNLAPKTIYLPNYHQNEGFNNSVMFFPVCCTFQ